MQGVGALELRPEPSPRFIPSPGLAPIAGPGAGLAAPVLIPPFPPAGVPLGPAAAVAGAFGVGLLIGDAINAAAGRPTLFNWGLLNPPSVPTAPPESATITQTGQIGADGYKVRSSGGAQGIREIKTEDGIQCTSPFDLNGTGGGTATVRPDLGGGATRSRERGVGPRTCGDTGILIEIAEVALQNGEKRWVSVAELTNGNMSPPGAFTGFNISLDYEPLGDPIGPPPPLPWIAPPKPDIEPEPELDPQRAPEPNRRPLAPPIQPPEPPPVPNAPPIAPPAPNPNPRPVPGPFPSPDPGVAPSPTPTPLPVPSPAPGPSPTPLPGPSNPIDNGGNLVPAPPSLPVITPPDARFPVPGGPDVTTPGPAPTLPGIAKEVGRIENKVDAILNGGQSNNPDWLLDLLRIIPFIEYLYDLFTSEVEGGSYTVEEKCGGKDYGDEGPPERTVIFPSAADPMEGILERLDALGDLAQANFDLKVNTCRPAKKAEGELVTVRFVSDANSPANNRPLRKLFRYRDLSGSSAADHSRHWKGFTWQAGPVCVTCHHTKVGVLQVWAADESEGKRVINFAASIAGFDTDKDGEWATSVSRNPRYGQRATMIVQQIWGFDAISKRPGSDGPPTLHA